MTMRFDHALGLLLLLLFISCSESVKLDANDKTDNLKPEKDSRGSSKELSNEALSLDEQANTIQRYLNLQVENNLASGVVVGLIEGNKTRIIKAGYSDFPNKLEVMEEHYFAIGSNSKTFTSLLLSHAVVNLGIKVDDPISKFIPEITNEEVKSITLRELSTHSSGLTRDLTSDLFTAGHSPFENLERKTLLSFLEQTKLQTDKETFSYSNVGVALLCLALERIYGLSFDQAIKQKILSPLGLEDIYVGDSQLPLMMSGKHNSGFDLVRPWNNLGIYNGVGSFKANINHMIKYVSAILEPKESPLHKSLLNSLKTLKVYNNTSSLYGWITFNYGDQTYITHSGSTMGFLSDIVIDKVNNRALIILNNSNETLQRVLGYWITGKNKEIAIPLLETYEEVENKLGTYFNEEHNVSIKVEYSPVGYMVFSLSSDPYQDKHRLYQYEKTKPKYIFLSGLGYLSFDENSGDLTFFQNVGDDSISYILKK